MIPRVKMIAPVPEYGMEVNTIITLGSDLMFILCPTYKINLTGIRKYPHIYRELNWWEERTEDELLQVKYAKTLSGNSVRKVKTIELWWNKIILDGGKIKSISKWLPATEQEYVNKIGYRQ